jgi:cyclophilin family peptidyl-prolyl cis-trans isomerase
MWPVMERLLDAYEGEIRFVYRHFPLSFHDKAQITAEAAEAAGAQGAYYEMYDLLLERIGEWSSQPVSQIVDTLAGYAEEIGLDVERFREELENSTYREKVYGHLQDAIDMQLGGTPSYIISGQPYPYGLSYEGLAAFIEEVDVLNQRHYDSPPPQVIDPESQYLATIETERGDVVVELYADRVPVNVNSFAFLAQDGWYDGITFAQVIADLAAVTGDAELAVSGFPGYTCQNEILDDLLFDQAGVVGIINSGLNMPGGHIFITLGPAPDLDGGFTIIGRVVEGLDIIEGLDPLNPSEPGAPAGVGIETITIEEQ